MKYKKDTGNASAAYESARVASAVTNVLTGHALLKTDKAKTTVKKVNNNKRTQSFHMWW